MVKSHSDIIKEILDENGLPISGAKVYFYDSGTLTPRSVYSDSGLTIAVSQPLLTDAAGRIDRVFVQTGLYRYIVKDADDVTLYDVDEVDPGIASGGSGLAVADGGTGSGTAAGARTNLSVPSQAEHDAVEARVTDIEQTLAVPLAYTYQTATYASTYAFTFTTYPKWAITLTGNVTFSAPTVTAGTTVTVAVIQDGTGGRTASWNSNYKFPGGTAPALSTTANAVDVFVFEARSSSILECVAYKKQDPLPSALPDIILEHQEASGTAGGGSSTSWATRTLNTEVYDRLNICTLSANQFTLTVAGTYYIEWTAPVYSVGGHKSALYSVTDAAYKKYGASASTTNYTTDESNGAHYITTSGSHTFRIEHKCGTATATYGHGYASSMGPEIYTTVKIWKVA